MILGHGIDLVSVDRFVKMDLLRQDRLADRILTDTELSEYRSHTTISSQAHYLAKIWAAKEAVSKSFGTGIQGVVVWKNIAIKNNELGCPVVTFKNELKKYADGQMCHISISHEGDNVIASAILSRNHNSFN
jgi:holo-[acyl-carrier protein] synthase